MTKDEIIEAMEDERELFLELLEALPEEAMLEPGVIGAWSVKDIVAHLNAWEGELVRLLWQLLQGLKPSGGYYNGTPVDELNAQWQAANQSRPLEKVLEDYRAVRKQTKRRLEEFPEEKLNQPQSFPWLKGQPLWEWVADNTFRHEAEHRQQIQEWSAKKSA